MKYSRVGLVFFLLGILAFSFSCAKKTIRTDAGAYAPGGLETKPGEVGSAERPEAKPEAVSPEVAAALEREKKLKEEDLREEALREEALRERTLQEEAARKETEAREAARMETEAREAALKAAPLETI